MFQLPEALQTDEDRSALTLLGRYFGADGPAYIGADFDTWDASGTRADDHDRFTSDDVVSLSFLSVPVPLSQRVTSSETVLRSSPGFLSNWDRIATSSTKRRRWWVSGSAGR
jgi:hypothetical protein